MTSFKEDEWYYNPEYENNTRDKSVAPRWMRVARAIRSKSKSGYASGSTIPKAYLKGGVYELEQFYHSLDEYLNRNIDLVKDNYDII